MKKQSNRNNNKNTVLIVLRKMSSKEKPLSLADLSYFTCLPILRVEKVLYDLARDGVNIAVSDNLPRGFYIKK